MKRNFVCIVLLFAACLSLSACWTVEQKYIGHYRYRHSYECRSGAILMSGSAKFYKYRMEPYTRQHFFRVYLRAKDTARVTLYSYGAEYAALVFYEGAEHPYRRPEKGKYSFFHDENVRLRHKFRQMRGKPIAGSGHNLCANSNKQKVIKKEFAFYAVYDGYYLIKIANICHQGGFYDLAVAVVNKFGNRRQ